VLSPRVAAEPAGSAPPLVLVLGGQRSGKSAWAEGWIEATGLVPVYLATAEVRDGEMAARVARHRERRGDRWHLIEEPLALDDALAKATAADSAVLVDCLTLWLSNLLTTEREVATATAALVAALVERRGPVALVSNEVGSGVIPMNPLARRFVDEAGRLHQRLAVVASDVVVVTAGLPRRLKAEAREV